MYGREVGETNTDPRGILTLGSDKMEHRGSSVVKTRAIRRQVPVVAGFLSKSVRPLPPTLPSRKSSLILLLQWAMWSSVRIGGLHLQHSSRQLGVYAGNMT